MATMRAAVLLGWGEELRLEDVPRPEPGPGEALIRVRACAPDQFDVTIAAGRVPDAKTPPLLLGHEIAGDVVEVGPGVEAARPGDRVTVFIYLVCGRCRFCLVGRDTLCERFSGYVGVHADGGYAEYAVVPGRNLVPIPADLDYAAACIIPGAVAAAYHAIDRRLKVRPAETVLIVAAAGGVGVHAVQLAKLAGARVIATDVSAERLEQVRALGADETVDVTSVDPVEATRAFTAGRGADKVLELVGTTESLDRSFRSLAPAGTMAIMGFQPGSELRADPVQFVQGEVVVTGSRSVSRQELRETIELVDRGAIRSIVSETRPLAEAQDVLTGLKQHRVYGRIALMP
jgi:D-arabinose 1-dehydrogenase-like Zn-dependent alcohol dehydrogenase